VSIPRGPAHGTANAATGFGARQQNGADKMLAFTGLVTAHRTRWLLQAKHGSRVGGML